MRQGEGGHRETLGGRGVSGMSVSSRQKHNKYCVVCENGQL